ncbi:flagellar biosynthetic protein FliO [Christensenellaceae bacterium OttesenSCG-928-M15]|nr:flagellar biosynthetic protein FliO [Christensenellaceae bacterium OttesenSCG-928-M15]
MQTPIPTFDIQSYGGAAGAAGGETDVWQILLMILYLVLILVGVYFATRLFARIGQKGFARSGRGARRRIYLVERMMFDKDKSVAIIHVDDREYLVGVSVNGIQILKENEIPAQEQDKEGGGDGMKAQKPLSFKELFSSMRDRNRGDR